MPTGFTEVPHRVRLQQTFLHLHVLKQSHVEQIFLRNAHECPLSVDGLVLSKTRILVRVKVLQQVRWSRLTALAATHDLQNLEFGDTFAIESLALEVVPGLAPAGCFCFHVIPWVPVCRGVTPPKIRSRSLRHRRLPGTIQNWQAQVLGMKSNPDPKGDIIPLAVCVKRLNSCRPTLQDVKANLDHPLAGPGFRRWRRADHVHSQVPGS